MRSIVKYIFLSLLYFTGLSSVTFSQCPPLYTFNGEGPFNAFGYSVASAGDVNNDGYADIIVGAYGNDNTYHAAGRTYVFSGLTGDTLYIFYGEAPYAQFGYSVATAGDVNNDGYADVIVGAPYIVIALDSGVDLGRAHVYSGQTGEELYEFRGERWYDWFGYSVSTAGDVDNDGYDDFVIGAFAYGSTPFGHLGRAYVFSGKTGDTLFVFTGETQSSFLGGAVSCAGDVDNDGFDDLIIGASGYNGTGRAYVFSGQSGGTLLVLDGETAGDAFGWSVSSAGDLEGDGYFDIVVGAPYSPFLPDQDATPGRVYVFSGQTGDTLYVFNGEAANDAFGISVSSTAVVDNDGFQNIIIGAPGHNNGTGRTYLFSGQTGETLHVFSGESADDEFGVSGSSAGDVDGDGNADFVIGAHANDVSGEYTGKAYVFSCCCLGKRGDVNGDGAYADILDLTYLVDRIFRSGPAAVCPKEADVNSDGASGNILDLTFLVDRIFRGGAAPGPC